MLYIILYVSFLYVRIFTCIYIVVKAIIASKIKICIIKVTEKCEKKLYQENVMPKPYKHILKHFVFYGNFHSIQKFVSDSRLFTNLFILTTIKALWNLYLFVDTWQLYWNAHYIHSCHKIYHIYIQLCIFWASSPSI